VLRFAVLLGAAVAVVAPELATAGRDAAYRGSGPAPAPALSECRDVDGRPQSCAPASLGSISFRTNGAFVTGISYRARWTCSGLDRDLIPGRLRGRARLSRAGTFALKNIRRDRRRNTTRSLGVIVQGRIAGARASGTFRQYFKASAGRGAEAVCDTGVIEWDARTGR
jgi:hypothetical protein